MVDEKLYGRLLLVFVVFSLFILAINLSISADPSADGSSSSVDSTTAVDGLGGLSDSGTDGAFRDTDEVFPIGGDSRTSTTSTTTPGPGTSTGDTATTDSTSSAGGLGGLSDSGTGSADSGTGGADSYDDFDTPAGTSIPTGTGSTTPTDSSSSSSTDATGGTGDSSSTTPSSTPTKQPEQLCVESDDYKAPPFNEATFGSNLSSKDEMSEKTFKDQWCSFQKSDKKDKIWGSLSEEQRSSLLKQVGKQYGTNIDIKGLKNAKWSNNNVLEVSGNKINLDFEKYYGKDNADKKFGFRGKSDYEYERRDIRDITVGDDGAVSISFGDEKTGQSSLKLKGGGIDFDPEKMTIRSGDETYTWNGQGKVDFDGKSGKLNMNFAKGVSDTDVTNFPIMKMPGGEEVSPFQEVVEGKKLKGLTPPSSGYKVDPSGKYTIDSKGVVREIKNSEVTIDKTGKITEVKDAFLNDKRFNGDIFASGSYGIGKRDKGSYIDLNNGVLTIVSNSGNKLYHTMGASLKKLDVKGAGSTYIRNGDYLLKYEGDKFNVRIVPKGYQKANGEAKYTIDEIVNQKDPKKPFKLIKGKDGKISLHDSAGNVVDINKFKDGQVVKPSGNDNKPGTTSNGDQSAVQKKYHIEKKGDGTYAISSDGYFGTKKVTSDTLVISGLDGNLPADMSYDDFIKKVGNEVGVTYTLKVESALVSPGAVYETLTSKMGMDSDMAGLIKSKLESTNRGLLNGGNSGNSLSISISGGKITAASWAGKSVLAEASKYNSQGTSFLQNVLKQSPPGTAKYSGTDSVISTPSGQAYYELYKSIKSSSSSSTKDSSNKGGCTGGSCGG